MPIPFKNKVAHKEAFKYIWHYSDAVHCNVSTYYNTNGVDCQNASDVISNDVAASVEFAPFDCRI